MRARRYIFITLIIVIIGGIYFGFTYQSPVTEREAPPEMEGEEADQARPTDQFKDIKLVLFSKDQPISWELTSNIVDHFTADNLLRLSTVSIRAVGEEDEELYNISADKGSYYQNREKLELTGPVKISREGMEMELGELQWDKTSNLISAQGGVRLKSPFFILTGSSLEAEPDLDRVTVSGDSERQAYFNWKRGE